MGLAIAEQLLQPGNTLICISRNQQASLTAQAQQVGVHLEQWTHDLADGAAASLALKAWLEKQTAQTFQSATLINNAGVIPNIGPLSQADPHNLAMALRVGLEAPMQLCAAFLGATENWHMTRKVVNISSGLGRRAMASQAGYCAAPGDSGSA
jgi:short-subunit dehydrogenase involved in D-alanine esterification of teichoic acids